MSDEESEARAWAERYGTGPDGTITLKDLGLAMLRGEMRPDMAQMMFDVLIQEGHLVPVESGCGPTQDADGVILAYSWNWELYTEWEIREAINERDDA